MPGWRGATLDHHDREPVIDNHDHRSYDGDLHDYPADDGHFDDDPADDDYLDHVDHVLAEREHLLDEHDIFDNVAAYDHEHVQLIDELAELAEDEDDCGPGSLLTDLLAAVRTRIHRK
jgi:hypothetical protein